MFQGVPRPRGDRPPLPSLVACDGSHRCSSLLDFTGSCLSARPGSCQQTTPVGRPPSRLQAPPRLESISYPRAALPPATPTLGRKLGPSTTIFCATRTAPSGPSCLYPWILTRPLASPVRGLSSPPWRTWAWTSLLGLGRNRKAMACALGTLETCNGRLRELTPSFRSGELLNLGPSNGGMLFGKLSWVGSVFLASTRPFLQTRAAGLTLTPSTLFSAGLVGSFTLQAGLTPTMLVCCNSYYSPHAGQ